MALASILDQSFCLTAGPSVSGNSEDDVAALAAAELCSEQIKCNAAVHVVLPSGKILIQVVIACLTSHTRPLSTSAAASFS